jgi:hypothetical protein
MEIKKDILEGVAKELNLKEMPSDEVIAKELHDLEDISIMIKILPTSVLLGAIYYISKGMPIRDAAARAIQTDKKCDEINKKLKAKGMVEDDGMDGVSFSV